MPAYVPLFPARPSRLPAIQSSPPAPRPEMILDCHCHIASRRIMPPEFFNGWSKTVKSNLPFSLDEVQERRVDELLHELTEDPDCVSMLQEMDPEGKEKANFFFICFLLFYNNNAPFL